MVAVWPVVNVEWFEPGSGGPAIQPHLAGGLDIPNGGWREYGNYEGLRRLVSLFDPLGVVASAALNSDVLRAHPGVARMIVESGWEPIAHGRNNSRGHVSLAADAESAEIAFVLGELERVLGRRPEGWLTPGFAVTPRTPELLTRAGLRYICDATDSDVPYVLETPAGPIIALPYSMETNDISLCLVARHTAAEYAEALLDHVRQLCTEARDRGPVMVALGLHTYIAGQPARALHLAAALREMAGMPQVWFATGSEIADAVAAQLSRT